MIIESKAPTRVDLAGGTLDIWPLYLFHPGAVTINAAISRYASCTIETNGSKHIRLVSRDIKTRRIVSLLRRACKSQALPPSATRRNRKFFQPEGGFTLTTDSEAPAGAGIGGSSAMAVAICAALDRFNRSREEQGRLDSHQPRRRSDRHQRSNGHAGPLSSGLRGAAAIELPPGGEHRVELRVNLNELERRIVVCYTGKPRQHGINNWEVFKAHINGKRAVQHSIERISDVAQKLRVALEVANWQEAGRLMREEWSFRKRNLPTISTKKIDRVIDGALRNGALAGKVCGAGGGGCVVLLIEPEARHRVESAILEAGAQLLPITIDRHGVEVISR